MPDISDKDLFEAAKLLISNISTYSDYIKTISADSLPEAYFKSCVQAEDNPDINDTKEILGIALGLETQYIPEKYR